MNSSQFNRSQANFNNNDYNRDKKLTEEKYKAEFKAINSNCQILNANFYCDDIFCISTRQQTILQIKDKQYRLNHYFPCFYIHFDTNQVIKNDNIFLITVSTDALFATQIVPQLGQLNHQTSKDIEYKHRIQKIEVQGQIIAATSGYLRKFSPTDVTIEQIFIQLLNKPYVTQIDLELDRQQVNQQFDVLNYQTTYSNINNIMANKLKRATYSHLTQQLIIIDIHRKVHSPIIYQYQHQQRQNIDERITKIIQCYNGFTNLYDVLSDKFQPINKKETFTIVIAFQINRQYDFLHIQQYSTKITYDRSDQTQQINPRFIDEKKTINLSVDLNGEQFVNMSMCRCQSHDLIIQTNKSLYSIGLTTLDEKLNKQKQRQQNTNSSRVHITQICSQHIKQSVKGFTTNVVDIKSKCFYCKVYFW